MSHLINTGHEDSIDAVDDLRLADRHVEHVHVRKSCPVSVKFKNINFLFIIFGGHQYHLKYIFSFTSLTL